MSPIPRLRSLSFASLTSLASLASLVILGACHRAPRGAASTRPDAAAAAVASATENASASEPSEKGRAHDVPDLRGPKRRLATIALQALLEGYGIAVAPEVLDRDVKLDADGASIDDVEKAAKLHGLDAEQVILPREAVLIPEAGAVPSLVLVLDEQQITQIDLLWRVDASTVQILDPALGRLTLSKEEFLRRLLIHEMPIRAKAWSDYANGPDFKSVLFARMARLGVPRLPALELLQESGRGKTRYGRAALDAALRQLESGEVDAGRDVLDSLRAQFACASKDRCEGGVRPPPPEGWTARPAPDDDAEEEDGGTSERVILRGAVLVRVTGRR